MGRTAGAMLVAFLAVVAAFTGATWWTQLTSQAIDRDALYISRDAAPAIEAVSSARGEMRQINAQVIAAVGGGTLPADLEAERSRLDAELARALSLPGDAHERSLDAALQRAMRSFDEATERALTQLRAGTPAVAQHTVETELQPAVRDAVDAATALVEHSAENAQAAAQRIEVERGRANRLALELDALAAVLAVVAALLALRAVRQLHAVERSSRELVERKAAELEVFAGRVAHDILSPLSSTGLAMTVAARTAEAPAKEVLARGQRSLFRVKRIVDGLLEFARAGAQPEPDVFAEVEPVVRELRDELQPMAEAEGATLKMDAPPACLVGCSAGVLISLLSNLLRNALKYLGDSQRREVTLRVQVQRQVVHFEVEDTGPGVPDALASRVFEPYVRGPRTGKPGIGLGLATVKRLVESHGGRLGLRRAPGGGALFWFELAAVEGSARHPSPDAARTA